MKAILEFNLDEHEDIKAHLRCVKSLDMALALNDIWDYIGHIWRESDEEDTVKINEVKEKIQDILENRDVYPDKLVS